ncbi:unnamed protein product, partial [Allacma fusca]
CMV